MDDRDSSAPDRGPEGESPWVVGARNALLVAVVLVMVWVALNLELPSVGELQARIEALGWGGWIAFVALYGLVAITPIPVTIMAVTGGFLFGTVLGSVLSVAGAFLGGWGAYWLARALGARTVARLLGRYRSRVESHLATAGFEAVCVLRLMPGVPYWPVNYGSGAFGVAHHVYVSASLLSIVPGQVSLVALGHFVAETSVASGVVLLIAWAVVIVLTVLAYRRWQAERAHTDGGSSA